MLPLAKPNLNSKTLEYTIEWIKTNWISSQGHFVADFEVAMTNYLKVRHAIACSSGTTALHLALCALEIDCADDVIVPSFTFIATANIVKYCSAEPILCDVDSKTFCIDVEDAGRRITSRTAVIIPVYINGHHGDIEAVLELALDRGLHIVEDACQALGGNYGSHKLGTTGSIGCFSFFANKQLTTGEGGMCVTNSDELAEKIRTLRNHGRNKEHRSEYVHDVIG
ncbi:hypothetical protein LCGC14_2636070, partial [marine sediment metagenome]